MNRRMLAALSVLLLLAGGLLLVARTARAPLAAQEIREVMAVTPISGQVAQVTDSGLIIHQVDVSDARPPVTVTVTPTTRIRVVGQTTRPGSLRDFAVGDEVVVTPVDDRTGTVVEARYIDVFR